VVVELAAQHDVEMPIATQVANVLAGQSVAQMLTELMGRPPKPEGA